MTLGITIPGDISLHIGRSGKVPARFVLILELIRRLIVFQNLPDSPGFIVGEDKFILTGECST